MLRHIVTVTALFIASFTGFTARPALAQELSVAVLGIDSVEGDDATARYLSQRLRELGGGVEGWHVRMEADTGLLQQELANGCNATEITCLQSMAGTLQVGALIFGNIRRVMTTDGPDFVLDMARYDALEMRIVADFTGRVPLHGSVETLNALATRVIEALSRTTTTAVAPDLPVGTSGIVTVPHDERGSDPPPASGPSGFLIGGISLLAGSALALAVDVGLWVHLMGLQDDPQFMAYRESFPAGGFACDLAASGNGDPALAARTRSVCGEYDSVATASYVVLAIAIASAIGGATLLALDATSGEQPDITVEPHIDAESAYVSVRGRF